MQIRSLIVAYLSDFPLPQRSRWTTLTSKKITLLIRHKSTCRLLARIVKREYALGKARFPTRNAYNPCV